MKLAGATKKRLKSPKRSWALWLRTGKMGKKLGNLTLQRCRARQGLSMDTKITQNGVRMKEI